LNVLAQNTLHMMTSFLTFVLIARFLFSKSNWLEIGLVSAMAFIALSGSGDLKDFLTPWQIYTPALMFGLCALVLAPPYWLLSFCLLCVAVWCNFSVTVLLGILLAARALEESARLGWSLVFPALKLQVLMLGISSLVGYVLRLSFPTGGSNSYAALASPYEALTGWIRLLQDSATSPSSSLWLLLAPPIVGLGFCVLTQWRSVAYFEHNRTAIRSAVVGVVSLTLYAMIVGATAFAKSNGYSRRYLIPSLMIWIVSWVGLTMHLWPKTGRVRPSFRFAGALLVVPLLILRFGTPSFHSLEHNLAERFDSEYGDVVKAQCTHVIGDYYRVWDSVFYSRIIGDRELWGITYRSGIIRDKWDLKRFSDPRICYWKNNEQEALDYLSEFSIEGFEQAESIGKMMVLTKLKGDSSSILLSQQSAALLKMRKMN
jgi:hypothetical protein